MFLDARDGGSDSNCVQCPTPPPCNCNANQSCVRIARGCNACDSVMCVNTQTQQTSSGPSTSALAGAISAVVILAILVFAGYFWWRRRKARPLTRSEKAGRSVIYDVPASADTVLSRPDPIEKSLPVQDPRSNAATPLPDNASQRSAAIDTTAGALLTDPFADQASIQTASARTHSPNVITIGLIPPPDGITALRPPPGPTRPARSPGVSLRSDDESVDLAHVNVSNDSLQPPKALFARGNRQTQLSTKTAGSRASVISSSSSTFDILMEAPTIVTPVQGAVRQVLGVVKAEVVQAPPTSPANGQLVPGKAANRPSRSPLGLKSFTSEDVNEDGNPFSDDKSTTASRESVQSNTTFGMAPSQTPSQWTFPPTPTWQVESRPTSIASNAGTITADIGNATRVVLGMQSPQFSTAATAHTSIATMGSAAATVASVPLTPPPTAAQTEVDPNRLSQASIASAASSHADSILEAFPFVPPSPIAARPPRSPGLTFSPPSPARSTHSTKTQVSAVSSASTAPQRPERSSVQSGTSSSRRTLGMSTASAMSSSSGLSGLDSFTFKFSDAETPPLPQNTQRASLDTLALSRDLEAFPLPYDDQSRDSYAPSHK